MASKLFWRPALADYIFEVTLKPTEPYVIPINVEQKYKLNTYI